MIETRRLKNVVFFFQTILSFVLSRKIKNKISTNNALTKVAGTKIINIETDLDGFKKSDLTGYAKKTEVANDITTIKNDYVTNASLTS